MDELNVYLQNHWAAAAGGQDLARRVARSHRDSDLAEPLAVVAAEVSEDREALRELMGLLGLGPRRVGPAVARLGERIGRLKPNGHLLQRSPASDVLELEALRAAVSARLAGWDALHVMSATVPRLPQPEVERLQARAVAQLERLADVHRRLAARRLAAAA